ncbi:MAG: RidA family protein [Chloroflexi bacterium]|nr:RidA family protein [Chloroflexota bacterium]MCZ6789433.1 RidA family protein [Chloroflexota bacterium]MCZ6892041.1 RidA family protein [Chloroflexota bacterium]
MSQVEDRLKDMGYSLPNPPDPTGTYIRAYRTGNLVFLAGVGPWREDGSQVLGKVGRELTVEQGYEAARLCALNSLANLKETIGDLDRVVHFVKVLGMINVDPEFGETPAVMNGYSDLLVAVFGEKGHHARSAVGMGTLPRGMAVEVEAIVEVES